MRKIIDLKELESMNSGMEFGEGKFYDGVQSMKRLKVKSKLLADVNVDLCEISKLHKVYSTLGYRGRRLERLAAKEFYKDCKKGMKIINQNIPVFIELPKLKKEGNGAYSEKRKDDPPNKTKTIIYEDVLQDTEERLRLGVGEEDQDPKQEN